MKMIAIWGVIAIGACVIGGIVAAAKNRNHSTWMAWCFVVPPLLLVLLLLPRNPGPTPRHSSLDEEDRAQTS